MVDLLKRFLVVTLMAICISILFWGGNQGHAESNKVNGKSFQWEWPTIGEISDHFGTRGGGHFGIDIAADKGTSIHVVEDGTVVKSYYSGSYGNVVFVAHPDGMETVYAHMSKRLVDEGEKVKKGQLIGLVGNTGRSYGTHLHFEVHNGEWNIHKSNAIDPLVLLDINKLAKNEDENKVQTVGTIEVVKEVIEIQKGDTLWQLAKTFEVTVEDLMNWNQLTSDLIVTGDELIVFKKEIKEAVSMADVLKERNMLTQVTQVTIDSISY
jgi:LysM repeat protein